MSTHSITKQHTQQSSRVKHLTLTGLMAAMITIMTAYLFHIPLGANGGYLHFGDSLIYLAAAILPTPYALAAAAIGGGLADLLTAPIWIPATILIKMLITLPFTKQSARIITLRNVIAALIAYPITGIGYFLAEYVIFGSSATAFLASLSSNLIQSAGSAIFFLIFGLALDKAHIKARLAG